MTPEEFEKGIKNVDVLPEIEKKMKLCLIKMQSEIKHNMDTTPRSDKPYFSKRSNKMTYPSLPYHPPAPDTGKLKDSVNYEVSRTSESSVMGRIGSTQNGLPYGAWHELGLTRNGVPRPWLAPVVEENLDFLKEQLGVAVKAAMNVNFAEGN